MSIRNVPEDAATLAAHIVRIVDAAPPLTDKQRETLAALLHPRVVP